MLVPDEKSINYWRPGQNKFSQDTQLGSANRAPFASKLRDFQQSTVAGKTEKRQSHTQGSRQTMYNRLIPASPAQSASICFVSMPPID
jgi:hypothetical protein